MRIRFFFYFYNMVLKPRSPYLKENIWLLSAQLVQLFLLPSLWNFQLSINQKVCFSLQDQGHLSITHIVKNKKVDNSFYLLPLCSFSSHSSKISATCPGKFKLWYLALFGPSMMDTSRPSVESALEAALEFVVDSATWTKPENLDSVNFSSSLKIRI